jgi:hypothetical protein
MNAIGHNCQISVGNTTINPTWFRKDFSQIILIAQNASEIV